MIALGIDPGLRSTGLALVEGRGPELPAIRLRKTLRVASTDERARADDQAHAIVAWVEGVVAVLELDLGLIALERFDHRAWLQAADGSRRRVPTAPAMGRLVGRLLADLGRRWPVVEVDPAESKAGLPVGERFRARLLPPELRNRHERDAYLAAATALTLRRREALA